MTLACAAFPDMVIKAPYDDLKKSNIYLPKNPDPNNNLKAEVKAFNSDL